MILDVIYQDDIDLEDSEGEDIYSAESEIGFHLMGLLSDNYIGQSDNYIVQYRDQVLDRD
ncbi:hypothetical protein ACQ4M3_36825 [Leptolyngbya sp. AN03gr2]|uniref:hypothetical protein n=1 Tax=unclassified Leptolyngbya TaxID=2650499 RepID=UPI003D31D9CB